MLPKKILFSVYSLLTFLLVSCASSNKEARQTPEQKKAEIYYGQGTEELLRKDYAQALAYLLKAKEFDPKSSKIRNNLAMSYYFREQYALAENELKDALNIDKQNTDAHLNLGALYMEKNRLPEARFHFEKALLDLTFSNQYRNYYNLAILSLKEGDRREAFLYLNKSIKEREDYCSAHFKLGELYSEEYRFKEALIAFKESGKGTCVNQPAPLYQQALALANLNRIGEARNKFQEILDKFPTSNFSALATTQLKNINEGHIRQATRNIKTETIEKSTSTESPNF